MVLSLLCAILYVVHGHERKDTDSVSTVPFETQSLPTGILNEQNKDKREYIKSCGLCLHKCVVSAPYRPQRSDPHPLPSHPLPMKQRICKSIIHVRISANECMHYNIIVIY